MSPFLYHPKRMTANHVQLADVSVLGIAEIPHPHELSLMEFLEGTGVRGVMIPVGEINKQTKSVGKCNQKSSSIRDTKCTLNSRDNLTTRFGFQPDMITFARDFLNNLSFTLLLPPERLYVTVHFTSCGSASCDLQLSSRHRIRHVHAESIRSRSCFLIKSDPDSQASYYY
jgi:hypothetical protein